MPRPRLPTGTVTFLFTDVEGSTRLLADLGEERYAETLAAHRTTIREACAAHDGVEVDTQGDAFFFAFPTAPGALAAAAELTAALAERGPIRVRTGLHTGTPLVGDEGYVGHDVHRAARIAAAGHGGQVLVSAATAPLVSADLRDLGHHRFKDLAAAERVFQLGHREFPPIRSLFRTNLPVPATPFLGRVRELKATTDLLARSDVRLLTLTGPGGTGKTRLAIQAAAEASDDHPDGVWWIQLADLSDPVLVLEAAAGVLGSTGPDLAERIASARLLLVFDNFEHVLEAATDVAALLAACPNLTVLATSREPLHLSGEHTYAVPSLDRDEAVAYFVSRAQAVDPGVERDDAVARICARLDDLPLALELAAARVKALSPTALLARLDARLPLLDARARDVPDRQRTLRATIEWSYDLLAPEEQGVFRSLSVFAGGCTLESAEAVTGAGFDAIESLVDKSLLRHTDGRYWMLATIREYAANALREAAEADAFQRRHAQHLLALARTWNLGFDAEGDQRFELAAAEVDNVRAALHWAVARQEIELGLELAVALDYFWYTNHPDEAARWFEALLAAGGPVPRALELRALHAYGNACSMGSVRSNELTTSLWNEALTIAVEIDEPAAAAGLLLELANLRLESVLDQAGAGGSCDDEDVDRLLREALEAHARSRKPQNEVFRLDIEATLARHRDHDLARAGELLAQAIEVARRSGLTWWEGEELSQLAIIEREAGRLDLARSRACRALERQQALGHRTGVVGSLAILATTARAAGEIEHAGWLLGAIEAEEARLPTSWALNRGSWQTRLVADGEPAFERGRQEGWLSTLDEAVERALALERTHSSVG